MKATSLGRGYRRNQRCAERTADSTRGGDQSGYATYRVVIARDDGRQCPDHPVAGTAQWDCDTCRIEVNVAGAQRITDSTDLGQDAAKLLAVGDGLVSEPGQLASGDALLHGYRCMGKKH